MLEALFHFVGGILGALWAPMIVVTLFSFVAMPALRVLPIREELRRPLQSFFRIAGAVSTTLVLMAFAFMFAGLWLAAQTAPPPL
jgi:hypothetical protein